MDRLNATSAVAAVVIGLLLAGGPMVRAAPPVDPPGTVAPAAEAARTVIDLTRGLLEAARKAADAATA